MSSQRPMAQIGVTRKSHIRGVWYTEKRLKSILRLKFVIGSRNKECETHLVGNYKGKG